VSQFEDWRRREGGVGWASLFFGFFVSSVEVFYVSVEFDSKFGGGECGKSGFWGGEECGGVYGCVFEDESTGDYSE
jgi:hypothetical protein